MSAESVVQAAVLAAVRGVAGLNGVYLGPPVKATVPFAELGDLLSGDWSVKDRAGRELRLIVTVRDAGDSPARAQALDFIERSEKKFDTHAGERGRMLSGGERQRLSIARALLKDPPILILDEATSALDAVTEAKVNAALDEVMKGRTTFVIAHRLSTIRYATRILLFDQGRVIESGTFDELVAKGGRFADLARAQFMVQEQARAGIETP